MVDEKYVNNSQNEKGLTEKEANIRFLKYGPNELQKKQKISPIKIFFSQFNDFITWILIVATIISGLMGDLADAVTILIIVIMNAVLSFIQEYRTEKSLDALKKMSAPTAKVLRDGKIKVIEALKIVVGDIVILESGDRVPADGIVVESLKSMVDESLLTGESVGVTKSTLKNENSVHMGTIVLTGKLKFKVVSTGMDTEMGKIAHMLNNITEEKSPLKEKLESLGKILIVICLAICLVVTVLGIFRGNDITEMFLLGVSLAVAAIPEGLTAIVTVSLALGVSRMLKRNALIRKLPAVETLGCTSVICSDKTGTLTENNMTVKKLYYNNNMHDIVKISNDNVKENIELKNIFTYCNDCDFNFNEKSVSKALFGDPTETALVKCYFEKPGDLEKFLGKGEKVNYIPFDSNRKMMSVVIKNGSTYTAYVKGAPERVIEKCNKIMINGKVEILNSKIKKDILSSIEKMSYNALRCIAGAYKNVHSSKESNIESDLIFVGVAGIIDPPRKEVKEAVLKCKIAGIRPVMITGDHKNTAFAIGKELNICKVENEVLTGEEINKLEDVELDKKLDNINIFARVSPNHKLRIVKAFKRKNKIVAMTGDGVNDAPAVKEADIGISMGISGTDVTKEASSMILLDDNFKTIVSAVEEGRLIYDNIRKFIRYLLSCNLGEVLTMFLASLFYLPTPLLPIQILFVNLATDGLPAIALGLDPADSDIMSDKPRNKSEGIFARGLWEKILLRGGLIGICTVGAFIYSIYCGFTLEQGRTICLATLVLSQLIHVFECRSERHSLFTINILGNVYLIGAVIVSIAMLLLVIYIPYMQGIFHTTYLDLSKWGIVIFLSSIIAFINSTYLWIKKR